MRNILGRTSRTLAIGLSITIFLATVNLGYAQLQQNATPIIIQSPPIIMQQPSIPTGANLENQPSGNFANQTTELIVAIAAAVGTVASLALAVLNRMGLFKNKEAVTEVAKTALTFSNKLVERQRNDQKNSIGIVPTCS
jgi:hypothetical protein